MGASRTNGDKPSMECFYCKNGETSRCDHSLVFGHPKMDGGQAEYVRVPLADGTLFSAPPEIPEETVVLMADIVCSRYLIISDELKR